MCACAASVADECRLTAIVCLRHPPPTPPPPRSPWSYPGPANSNYDFTGSTVGTGTALYTGLGSSLAYWAVQTSLPAGVTGEINASYYVAVSAGTGTPALLPPANPSPTVTRDPSNTILTVQWAPPSLANAPGAPFIPAGVTYSVYVFAAGPGSGGSGTLPQPLYGVGAYNLFDTCGVHAAHASCPGMPGSSPGCASITPTAGTGVAVANLDPAQTYTVALTATCASGSCMPAGMRPITIAYVPVAGVAPVAPGASSSPSPSAPPSSSPPAGSTNHAALAGGIAGALIVSLGVGFFLYRRGTFDSVALAMPSFGGGGSRRAAAAPMPNAAVGMADRLRMLGAASTTGGGGVGTSNPLASGLIAADDSGISAAYEEFRDV